MSAEKLRKAASLMRERAELTHDGYDREYSAQTWRATYWVGRGYDDDSEHIASWHPAVALCIADWLDRVAGDARNDNYEPTEYQDANWVATAYLGGAS